MIRLLTYQEIDRKAWDDCMDRSSNKLIYGNSLYLDYMAPGWQGLVLNQYEAVMPLTARRKWGIPYLYRPAFFQQGGIYSPTLISKEMVAHFIKAAMCHFPFAEISMNYANEIPEMNGLHSERRENFIIPLDKSAAELTDDFSESFKKNSSRAKILGLHYSETEDAEMAVRLYKSLYGRRLPSVKSRDYDHFLKLTAQLKKNGGLIIRKVTDSSGRLLAAALLLQEAGRMYNLMSSVTREGRQAEANYFLFENLITEFAGSGWILDLEGSDIPGVADFYRRMSPRSQPYFFIRFNRLPGILRIFKK